MRAVERLFGLRLRASLLRLRGRRWSGTDLLVRWCCCKVMFRWVSSSRIYLDGPDPKSKDVLRVPSVRAREQGNFFFDCELG